MMLAMRLLVIFCLFLSSTLQAQVSLSASEGVVHMISDYSKYDDGKEINKEDHEILINFDLRKIIIKNLATEEVVFDLDYTQHIDGTSQSAILQPGENVFFVRSEEIELCSYQDMFKSFSVNYINKRTLSFMGIERQQ